MTAPMEDLLNILAGEGVDPEGLNSFYLHIERKMRDFLRGDSPATGEDFRMMVELRTLPPIIALSISDGYVGFEERKASLAALIEELGGRAPFTVKEGPLARARETLSKLRSGDLKSEIVIQVFEVGSKQETILRNGGFREMRGASALIDIIPKVAARVVERELGREFIIGEEAGELIFLSKRGRSEVLQQEILGEVYRVPLADVLTFKGNGTSAVPVTADRLMEDMGHAYLLALSSAVLLREESEQEDFRPSELCRACRRERGLSESEIRDILSGLIVGDVQRLYQRVTSKVRGEVRICRTCLAFLVWGTALVDTLEGKGLAGAGYEWKDDVKGVIGKSSAFEVLKELKDLFEKRLREGGVGLNLEFVRDLDQYGTEERNALISLISADGDGFGRLKTGSRSIVDFYTLSLLFYEMMRAGLIRGGIRSFELERAILLAAYRGGGRTVPTEFLIPLTPLFVAGDDMVFITRAEHSVAVMKGIYEGALNVLKRARDLNILREERIGISLGMAVARTKVPGLFLYRASHRILDYVKRVVKEHDRVDGFSVHSFLVYTKSTASWEAVDRITEVGEQIPMRETLLEVSEGGISPALDSLRIALMGGGCDSCVVRAGDLKDVMEDLLSESRHHELSLLRWLSDISRSLDPRGRGELSAEKGEVLRKMYERIVRVPKEGRVHLWRSVYAISSILDAIEDRIRLQEFREELTEEMTRMMGG